MSTEDVLFRLSETLASRRDADPERSYTARLLAGGPDSILKKIGEESAELIMAAKDGERASIVYESADLIYHMWVLLSFYGIGADEVLGELRRREGTSGIDEKKSRPSSEGKINGKLPVLQDRAR
ncbi:MAG: phosphoribosyl-ATP diphosphatase [Candidatus Accumulibacter sp.]|jgi:phosphoribosyl-ATP pyrophosphohydrolase|nr:phosphoribosyl-ATP diphosphatase [Accumulibacter sp.]